MSQSTQKFSVISPEDLESILWDTKVAKFVEKIANGDYGVYYPDDYTHEFLAESLGRTTTEMKEYFVEIIVNVTPVKKYTKKWEVSDV